MPENSKAGIWVDCVVKIIGWFQISANLNPNTNNYLPETDSAGNPVSGDGWAAYEKPGANPGDIVIIYYLETAGANGAFIPTGIDFSTVLWDLINPGGISYFLEAQHLKISVNRSDLVTNLPHAGSSFIPINPDNPFGHQDILWHNVTGYYGLPGPGNANNPNFIKWTIPSFGIRIIVWTDECCLANQITALPPAPPVEMPPPVKVPPPGHLEPAPPNISGPSPGPGGNRPGGGAPKGTQGLSFGSAGQGDNPSFREYSSRSSNRYIKKIPGTSQKLYTFNDNQISIYTAEDHPFGFRYKPGATDQQVVRRAVPIGLPYQYKANKYINENVVTKKTDVFILSASVSALATIGIGASLVGNGLSVVPGRNQPAPSIRNGASELAPNASGTLSESQKTNTEHNRFKGDSGLSGMRTDPKTIGGFGNTRPGSSTDVDFESSKYIAQIGTQARASDVLQKNNFRASKDVLGSNKGILNLAGLTNRSIETNASIKNSTFTKGYFQSQKPRYNGIDISKASRIYVNTKLEQIKDTEGRFDISFLTLRSVNDIGAPGILSIVRGNTSTAVTAILKQTFFVHSSNSSYGIVLDSSPIEFGVVNPVTPGMYVIGNPTCLPGQGSLPAIIAGGDKWNFAQLVVTLLTTEGITITQSVYNFTPSFQGDTDIIAPNRLPVGLMRDLDIISSANSTYEGSFSQTNVNQLNWYKSEPCVIVERIGSNTNSTVSIVLKCTTTSLLQSPSFKPLLEIYNDTVLITNDLAIPAFVGGPCSALPGWINPSNSLPLPNGGYHTACPGSAGLGGAGGTSAYIVNNVGGIQSGPYNPAVYGGTHQAFLCFKYNLANNITDSTYINAATDYRIRVYNNGPASEFYGYVLYTSGLKVKNSVNSTNIDSNGYLSGSIITYHCNQIIKIRNHNNGQEIERYSNHVNGKIDLGSGSFAGFGAQSSLRLQAVLGDTIKVFRPGYDNLYTSENLIAEFTV